MSTKPVRKIEAGPPVGRSADEFALGGDVNWAADQSAHHVALLTKIPPQYHAGIAAYTSSVDVTGWIQDAADEVREAGGGVVTFPPGLLKHGPIGATNAHKVSFRGAGDWYGGTILDYVGPAGSSAIKLTNSDRCEFHGLFMRAAGNPVFAFIESYRDDGIVFEYGIGGHRFQDVFMFGGDVPLGQRKATYGIAFTTAGGDANNADCRFDRVFGWGMEEAAFYFGHAQSKHHLFIDCSWLSVKYGVKSLGSFRSYGGGGGYADASDFWQQHPNDTIVIHGFFSENSKRLFETGNPTSAGCPVMIEGCRFDSPQNLAADAYVIKYGWGAGPLIVRGNILGSLAQPMARIWAEGATTGGGAATVGEISSNMFLGTDADTPATSPVLTTNNPHVISIHGNTYQKVNGTPLRRSGEQIQFSGTAGSFTISDATQIYGVTLTRPEPDGSYQVVITVGDQTGTPSADSAIIERVWGKTTVDFTVLLKAAPGAGNSRTFNYTIAR